MTRRFRHVSRRSPAYDRGPRDGIGAERWGYAVTDGTVALSLDVCSGVHVNPYNNKPPEGWTLYLHTRWPTEIDQLTGRQAPDKCALLRGGRCFLHIYCVSDAQRMFRDHGRATFRQPPSFWRAMEAECVRLAELAEKDRVDLRRRRCSCCRGKGHVRREVKP